MIVDIRDYSQVDENYLRNQAKAIETRNLKKYQRSPDWIALLRRLNAAIVTTYKGGYTIDRKKLNTIKKEIAEEVANENG